MSIHRRREAISTHISLYKTYFYITKKGVLWETIVRSAVDQGKLFRYNLPEQKPVATCPRKNFTGEAVFQGVVVQGLIIQGNMSG